MSRLEAKNDGIIKFNNLNWIVNQEGDAVVVNRNASIAILDHRGREIEHYQVPLRCQDSSWKDTELVKAHRNLLNGILSAPLF